jgi:hypothetical protein
VSTGPVAIGDEQFLQRLARIDQEPEPESNVEQLAVTINARGEIIGDTSHLPENILAQLSTPEAQAQMKAQWKQSRYADQREPPREVKYLNEGTQRLAFKVRPKRMNKAESRAFRTACRKELNKMTKAAIKIQRSMTHGRKSDESAAG